MTKRSAFSIVLILVWLVASCWMNKVYGYLTNQYTFHPQYYSYFSILTLFEILFAGATVSIFWLILVHNPRSSLTGWMSIGLGLLAFLLASPFIISSLNRISSNTLIDQTSYIPFLHSAVIYLSGKFYFFARYLVPLQYFGMAAALTIALGVANLLRKSPKLIPTQS